MNHIFVLEKEGNIYVKHLNHAKVLELNIRLAFNLAQPNWKYNTLICEDHHSSTCN